MKRILSILCTLCLVLTLVPSTHAASLSVPDEVLAKAVGGSSPVEFEHRAGDMAGDLFMHKRRLQLGVLMKMPLKHDHEVYQYLVGLGLLSDGTDILPRDAYDTLEKIEDCLLSYVKNPDQYYYRYVGDLASAIPPDQLDLLAKIGAATPMELVANLENADDMFSVLNITALYNIRKNENDESLPLTQEMQTFLSPWGLPQVQTLGEVRALAKKAQNWISVWLENPDYYYSILNAANRTGQSILTSVTPVEDPFDALLGPSSAGSIFDDSGSVQTGPVVLGVCGGVVLGMGLMYVIMKKKTAQA